MPARDVMLVRAARTLIREDRLTELLRVVLSGNRGFAHLLLEDPNVGLPAEGPVEVATQVWTGSGRRIDMQVLSYDSSGHEIRGRLWSEHKTGSPFSEGQLEDYAEDLRSRFAGDTTRLITITSGVDDAEEDPLGRWSRLTWQRVASLADEAGRAECADWREHACDEQAPARLRILHELLTYLEEEHNVVLDPVSHLDILAFARADRASEVMTELLTRAGRLSGLDPVREADYNAKDSWQAYWQLFDESDTWAARLGGHPELHLRGDDAWVDNRIGQPALGAGFTLPGHYYERLRSSENREWLERIEGEGFSVGQDGWTRVYRTRYLAEVLAAGPLLDAQATAVAEWTKSSIETLKTLDPGLEPISVPVKRRGQNVALADDGAEAGEDGDD